MMCEKNNPKKHFSLQFFFIMILFSVSFNSGCCQSYMRDEGKVVSPWLHLQGGIFSPVVKTEVTFDAGPYNSSITSNLEDEFKLSSSPSLFYLKAIAGNRSQVVFSMYKMNREGNALLTRDINVDGTVYHVGANAHSYFNTAHYAGTFRYAFYSTE